jgi:hypothetical protein
MRPLALLLMLSVAGCGRDSNNQTLAAPDTNQIERLSTPAKDMTDPLVRVRLQPLTPQDLAEAGLDRAPCGFSSDGMLLLATAGSSTLIKVGGEIIRPSTTGPVGPSGGFFEASVLTISIGRTEAGQAYDEAGSAPARATLTDRQSRAQAQLMGIWACRV